MRLFRLSLLSFSLGLVASVGVFFGLHFLLSAYQHGGVF